MFLPTMLYCITKHLCKKVPYLILAYSTSEKIKKAFGNPIKFPEEALKLLREHLHSIKIFLG
jgi:hypothetical protein